MARANRRPGVLSPAAIADMESYLAKIDTAGNQVGAFHTSNRSGASFYGAAIDALTKGWTPRQRSGDDALKDSWPLLSGRIDDLMRNEPSLGQCERALVKHIVRTGIMTFAEVMNPDRTLVEDFNDESDEEYTHWSECEADVEGKQSLQEMQWSLQEQVIRRGDGLMLWCLDKRPGRELPLCLQLLEAAQLDDSKEQDARDNENRIVRGVELDAQNRAVAYWIFDAHPYDSSAGWTNKSVRIPADRVIHYFVPFTPSATRGVPWFHALVRVTRDSDWFLGSELTAAALGALLVMIHKQKKMTAGAGMGLGDGGDTSDEFGNPLVKLGPGVKVTIPAEDDIELVESKRPGKQTEPFMKFMRQEQSMGAGLSALSTTMDFSQTSFTSAHGAANEEWAYIEPLQGRLSRRVVKPIRRRWTINAAAYGLFQTLSPTQFLAQQRKWLRIAVQPPGRDQLNPRDQTGASIDRMRSGLSNLILECGREGRNWRHVLRGKAQVEQYAIDLGTSVDWTQGAGTPAAAAEDEVPAKQPATGKPDRYADDDED